MKIKNKKIIFGLITFACIIIGIFLVSFISTKRVENKYKQLLINKYGFNKVTTIEFKNKHKLKNGEWHYTATDTIPAYGSFQCDDRVVTVYDGKDDYYYDELVEGVRTYYKNLFDTDNVIFVSEPSFDSSSSLSYSSRSYADFFDRVEIDAVDENTIEFFLKNFTVFPMVILQKNVNESEEEAIERIQRILDTKSDDITVDVWLMQEVSGITEYRKCPENGYYFDNYYIENIDSNKIIKKYSSF